MPITTWRPNKLGSRKSDVTRKNELYAFPTSTAGEKNQSLCVAAWMIATTANSVATTTAITASAFGSQGGNGACATTTTSTANGSRKYASTFSPEWRSSVQRMERPATAMNTVAGIETMNGTGCVT